MSGGADSTALLLALARVARRRGWRLVVAHLDHGQRGAAARADAEAVRALARGLALPCHLARLRPASAPALSEDGLRRRRRAFLARVGRRVGAAAICTAHTADDQLETLLMRLGRGTGLHGLAGMRAAAGQWRKPLLQLSRAEVEADLRAAGVPWREDATNHDPRWLRNRIRHNALPALIEALSPTGDRPRVGAALARRTAAVLAELAEAVQLLEALARRPRPTAALALGPWRRLAPVLRRARLGAWWQASGPSRLRLTRPHLAMLERVGVRGRGRVALPAGWWAEVSGDALVLHPEGGPRSGPGRRPGRTVGPAAIP